MLSITQIVNLRKWIKIYKMVIWFDLIVYRIVYKIVYKIVYEIVYEIVTKSKKKKN